MADLKVGMEGKSKAEWAISQLYEGKERIIKGRKGKERELFQKWSRKADKGKKKKKNHRPKRSWEWSGLLVRKCS